MFVAFLITCYFGPTLLPSCWFDESNINWLVIVDLLRLVGKEEVKLSPCSLLTRYALAQYLHSRAKHYSQVKLWWNVHLSLSFMFYYFLFCMWMCVGVFSGVYLYKVRILMKCEHVVSLPTKRRVVVRESKRREKANIALSYKVNYPIPCYLADDV